MLNANQELKTVFESVEVTDNGSFTINANRENNAKLKDNLKMESLTVVDSELWWNFNKNPVKKNIADSVLLDSLEIKNYWGVLAESVLIHIKNVDKFTKPRILSINSNSAESSPSLMRVAVDKIVAKKGLINLQDRKTLINQTINEDLVLKANANYIAKNSNGDLVIIQTITESTSKPESFEIKMNESLQDSIFANYLLGQEAEFYSFVVVGKIDKAILPEFESGRDLPVFKVEGRDGIATIYPYNESAKEIYPEFNKLACFMDLAEFNSSLNGINTILKDKMPSLIIYESEMNTINLELSELTKEIVIWLRKYNVEYEYNEDSKEIEFFKNGQVYDLNQYHLRHIAAKLLKIQELIIEANQSAMTNKINKRADKTLSESVFKIIKKCDNYIDAKTKEHVSNVFKLVNGGIAPTNKEQAQTLKRAIENEKIRFESETNISSQQAMTILTEFQKSLLNDYGFNGSALPNLLTSKDFKNIIETQTDLDGLLPKPEGTKRLTTYDLETTGLFGAPQAVLAVDFNNQKMTELECIATKENNPAYKSDVFGITEGGYIIYYRNEQEASKLLKNGIIDNSDIVTNFSKKGDVLPTSTELVQDGVTQFAAVVIDYDIKTGRVIQKQGLSEKFSPGKHISDFIVSLTGTTNEEVLGKPTLIERSSNVAKLFDSSDLITGMNNNKFDNRVLRILMPELCENRMLPTNTPVVDTIDLVRQTNFLNLFSHFGCSVEGGKGINTLDNANKLTNTPGHEFRTVHDALVDVMMTLNQKIAFSAIVRQTLLNSSATKGKPSEVSNYVINLPNAIQTIREVNLNQRPNLNKIYNFTTNIEIEPPQMTQDNS